MFPFGYWIVGFKILIYIHLCVLVVFWLDCVIIKQSNYFMFAKCLSHIAYVYVKKTKSRKLKSWERISDAKIGGKKELLNAILLCVSVLLYAKL